MRIKSDRVEEDSTSIDTLTKHDMCQGIVSSVGDDDITEYKKNERMELDAHANASVLSRKYCIANCSGSVVEVQPFSLERKELDKITIVDITQRINLIASNET